MSLLESTGVPVAVASIVLTFVAAPGPLQDRAVLLAESIRTYGGEIGRAPIWALVPVTDEAKSDPHAGSDSAGVSAERHAPAPPWAEDEAAARLSPERARELRALGVRFIAVRAPKEALEFIYAFKPLAAAVAESVVVAESPDRGKAPLLVWMDTDALVLHEPKSWMLPADRSLGCRPVDLTNISSPWNQPIDDYWREVYARRGVPPDRLAPVISTVDQNRLRPHYNVGLLVVRPEAGLFRTWREAFLDLYRRPSIEAFYSKDPRYRIFIHQAAFAAAALSLLKPQQILELPHTANYTMLLHTRYPDRLRLSYIDDACFARYDYLVDDPGWKETTSFRQPYRDWLNRRMAELGITSSQTSP